MPESLGRSHISAAHTGDDIDRSLEAAEASLRAAVDKLARPGLVTSSLPPGSPRAWKAE
jgi:hypothetical protein